MALNAQDFFAQFQPYEQGGITGQPSVDPSQLQQGNFTEQFGQMVPGGGITGGMDKSGGDGFSVPVQGYANRPPMDPNNLPMAPDWQSRLIDPNAPGAVPGIMKDPGSAWRGMDWMNPVDQSRYDPGKSYDDYARDYWAPDREQVLRQHPQAPVYHAMGGTLSNLGSMGSLGSSQQTDLGGWQQNPAAMQWLKNHSNATADEMSHADLGGPTGGAFAGGMGNLATLGSSALGGLFGRGTGGNGGNGMGVFQTLANKFRQMRTPSGKILSVPQEHVQEALRRGAMHL